jgi:hypothetical protein
LSGLALTPAHQAGQPALILEAEIAVSGAVFEGRIAVFWRIAAPGVDIGPVDFVSEWKFVIEC